MDNNKEDFFYKVINQARDIKLTERERTSLFTTVDAFVKKNPLKAGLPATEPTRTQPVKSPFFSPDWFHAFSQRSHNYYMAMALAILAVFGTGSSFAAQNSLPGDILYPIKVNILEEVKSIFLPSSLRPEYEILRTQTRIDEVKKLAEQDRLSDDVKASVAARIDGHISVVKKDISDLQQKGDLKQVLAISNNLESALDQSQDVIDTVDQNNAPKVAFVKDLISDSREETVKTREGIEEQVLAKQTDDENTKEIAQAKLDVTEKTLADIDTKLALVTNTQTETETGGDTSEVGGPSDNLPENQSENLKTTVALKTPATFGVKSAKIAAPAADTTPTIEDLVTQAKDLFQQGQEKMDNKEYSEAFRLFRESNYLTQIIEFRLGQTGDIGNELDTVLKDIDSPDSDVTTGISDEPTTTVVKDTKSTKH